MIKTFGKAEVSCIRLSISEPWEVRVNWYSIGPQTVEEARKYQNNIAEAIDFARLIESMIKFKTWANDIEAYFKQ